MFKDSMIPVQVTWTHATCKDVLIFEAERSCNPGFIVPIILPIIL